MRKRGIPLLDDKDGRALVRQKFKEAGLSMDLLDQLVDVELDHMGQGRRHGITDDIAAILDQAVESEA